MAPAVEKVGGWHGDPCRSSLGLLPSGPDPVGEWLVHHQPPGPHIGDREGKCKGGTGDATLGRPTSCLDAGHDSGLGAAFPENRAFRSIRQLCDRVLHRPHRWTDKDHHDCEPGKEHYCTGDQGHADKTQRTARPAAPGATQSEHAAKCQQGDNRDQSKQCRHLLPHDCRSAPLSVLSEHTPIHRPANPAATPAASTECSSCAGDTLRSVGTPDFHREAGRPPFRKAIGKPSRDQPVFAQDGNGFEGEHAPGAPAIGDDLRRWIDFV
jgi:hypothetical protein